MRIKTTPSGPTLVPEASNGWQRVLLVHGPYDGQDMRATSAEMRLGLIVRDKHKYVRSGISKHEPPGAASMPLFRWLQEARVALLTFLAMPCGL